jgi:hypothetical protein
MASLAPKFICYLDRFDWRGPLLSALSLRFGFRTTSTADHDHVHDHVNVDVDVWSRPENRCLALEKHDQNQRSQRYPVNHEGHQIVSL